MLGVIAIIKIARINTFCFISNCSIVVKYKKACNYSFVAPY